MGLRTWLLLLCLKLTLVADPCKGCAKEGQRLARTRWALQERVLALVQCLHHPVHVVDLAPVWLKWKVDLDTGNFDWDLELDDFFFFH